MKTKTVFTIHELYQLKTLVLASCQHYLNQYRFHKLRDIPPVELQNQLARLSILEKINFYMDALHKLGAACPLSIDLIEKG